VARVSLRAPEREAGAVEQLEDVEVVLLERQREREHVEVAERPPRLDRARLAPVLGEERALAGDGGIRVEEAVDRVDPEVRHPEPVGVRVDEGHPEPAARVLPERPALDGCLRLAHWPGPV
jgi:hypothetical protein